MRSLPILGQPELPAAGGSGTFAFVSLGCPKNLVDTERMMGLLATRGYTAVNDPRGADMVIVNTCGFIEASRAESRAAIAEMLALKEGGEVGGVIVTGCLAERVGPQLLEEFPELGAAVGVFGREEIGNVADRFMAGLNEQRTVFRPAAVKALEDGARLRITPRHFAYLKISEGCDRTCTFCAIPKMRGKHVTKPIAQILAEARELAADGVRELNIVAQDTTYYGMDTDGRTRLGELLAELEQVDGIEWLRLLYAYPEHIDDALIDQWAGSKKIVPYLDMPLQHISSPVLKRMQRRVNRDRTVELIDRLRQRWPGLIMRTTFIAGFPGETDEQCDELAEFLRAAKFERCGVFSYSREPGTPADRLDGHLPEDVKEARRDRLMKVQQEVAFAHAAGQVGKTMTALVDAVQDGADGPELLCRGFGDAPDIDTTIRVPGSAAAPGEFLKVRAYATDGYDLLAAPVGMPW
jgi:ribosomal protein S12 methylthiotransferase